MEQPSPFTSAIFSKGVQLSKENPVRVSIVVACRNEINHIHDLLDSILAQDLDDIGWEAIIADGMSSDRTWEILESYATLHPEIRPISNLGRIVSTGLNAAITAARGDYIIRMDAHTSYSQDYVRKCIETIARTGADNVGGPARTRATGLRARAIAAAYRSRFSTGGARFHDPTYEGWVDTVPYGCWRRETLQAIGLFDETLVRNQDDELNLRLRRAGGKIWQDPAILSWYSPRHSLSGLCRQYMQYGFWKVAVIRKHRLPGSWRHIVPGLFVLALACSVLIAALGAILSSPWLLALMVQVWTGIAAAYASALLIASAVAAPRAGWATLIYLPFVFPVFHFSYGFGFVAGLLHLGSTPRARGGAESAFWKLTR